MYDVVVIGAGPAGSTAAKTLAENGYKVLLVERHKMPRYKSCSGQLIKKSLDLVQTYFGEAVPVSTMCVPTENRGMIFTDDKGKSFRFEQPGLNVWRSSFDKWLMPHILPGCAIDYGVGQVLFAGEIAGFLNPMGEGISAGMESGYCAAKAIMQHFDNLDSVYADYKKRTESLHNYMKRQWSFVAGQIHLKK